MSKEEIVGRIISDAEEAARRTVAAAEEKAAARIAEANANAETARKNTEAEVAEKIRGILDGKAATARLDGAKIMLGAKREIIDELYAFALKELVCLGKEDSLALANDLLRAYAEEGDSIAFAENYPYVNETSALPIVREKKLKIAAERIKVEGGFVLVGERSDKNLSYEALLAADRAENEAELAAQMFVKG